MLRKLETGLRPHGDGKTTWTVDKARHDTPSTILFFYFLFFSASARVRMQQSEASRTETRETGDVLPAES